MPSRLRAVAVVAAVCALCPLGRPARSEATPIGLEYRASAPSGVPPATARCTDAAWTSNGFAIRGRQDLQRFVLLSATVPKNLDVSGVEAAITGALRVWNEEVNDCGRPDASPFELAYTGRLASTATLPQDDGRQTISFFSNPCERAIQVACARLHRAPDTGSPTGWDIALNTNYRWGLSSPTDLDVQSVLTHEFGHVAGLADVTSGEHALLTMYVATWPGDTVKRTLALGDALGLEGKRGGTSDVAARI